MSDNKITVYLRNKKQGQVKIVKKEIISFKVIQNLKKHVLSNKFIIVKMT